MHTFPYPAARCCFAAIALALVAAALAPAHGAAQGGRRATYLSDRDAPRANCRPAPRPARLPTLDVLADSAALMAGVDTLATRFGVTQDTSFVLFSVSLRPGGAPLRIDEREYYIATEMIEPLKALVSSTMKTQQGGGSLRIRIHPGTRRVLIGRSEVCEPEGPDRVRITRNQTSGRASYQRFRARILVGADGRAVSVLPSRGSGDSDIDSYVVRMLQSARYAPGLVDGVPMQMEYEQEVTFRQ